MRFESAKSGGRPGPEGSDFKSSPLPLLATGAGLVAFQTLASQAGELHGSAQSDLKSEWEPVEARRFDLRDVREMLQFWTIGVNMVNVVNFIPTVQAREKKSEAGSTFTAAKRFRNLLAVARRWTEH